MKKSIVFLTSLCLFCCLILKNVSAAESDIGYYVTYDGKNKKILDTYGESVGCLNGEISEVRSRIVSANAIATNYAKSQLSWLYENNGASLSCYLRQDINNKNQSRLYWRF